MREMNGYCTLLSARMSSGAAMCPGQTKAVRQDVGTASAHHESAAANHFYCLSDKNALNKFKLFFERPGEVQPPHCLLSMAKHSRHCEIYDFSAAARCVCRVGLCLAPNKWKQLRPSHESRAWAEIPVDILPFRRRYFGISCGAIYRCCGVDFASLESVEGRRRRNQAKGARN